MSDIFTVVLDLSCVKKDKKGNQLYLAMADTTKMKMICEFQNYIQFLFSLDCSVELFHEGVRLPDLEDIRVLSRLDVVQVRPVENVEEKYEGVKLISKSKECNEKHGDGEPRPVLGDNVANCNYIDSQESACSFKSLEAGKIIQAQEVSGFGACEKGEMLCGPSFPASNKTCSAVQKPKDKLMRKVCDMQENKTFRLGEKSGMAENLKLGTLLQNRYYGWCGMSDSNIVTGRGHFQKSNETLDLKSGEKPYLLKSSAEFTDVDGGIENKPFISSELKPGDVNISGDTFKGTVRSPVKLKETKNHESCHRVPCAHETRSKNCSRSRPDHHSSSCGSHVIPGTKPLTSLTANPPEQKSCGKRDFGRKPLSVDEALKILAEAAAERSKTLSGSNPASHNDEKKNQFRGACKTFEATPPYLSQNVQRINFKHQTRSKHHRTQDMHRMAQVILGGQNTKVISSQHQSHVLKLEKKNRVNKKSGSRDQNQGNALLKSCEKLNKNQNQKTGGIGKFEGETGAPNPPPPSEPTQKKKRSKKKKAKPENKIVSHSLLSDCGQFDNSHRNHKIGAEGKPESEVAPSNSSAKYGNVQNKIVPGNDLGEFSILESSFLGELLYSPAPNEIIKGKAFNDGESAVSEKSPSRKLNSSRGDSEPGARLRCRSPDNPTGVDIPIKDRSDFRFPGNDALPNPRRDLEMTDRVLENAEDEDGANLSDSLGNSFRNHCVSDVAVTQDEAASPFPDIKQGETVVCDDRSSKDDDVDKDKSESHSGSHVTNRVITLPNEITDNARVCIKGVNVSGNGGEGGLVSSHGQADPIRNHSRDGFSTEDAGALPGVGTGSIRVVGADPDSSGPRCVRTNEVIAQPNRSALQSVRIEEQDLHRLEGSGRDTKVKELPSSHAGSSGESANVRTGKDSKSDVTQGRKNSPPFLKECVIALFMIITALAF